MSFIPRNAPPLSQLKPDLSRKVKDQEMGFATTVQPEGKAWLHSKEKEVEERS